MEQDASILSLEVEKLIFDEPERIIITGSSGTGKTHLVEQLVKKYAHRFYRIMVVGTKNDLMNFQETKGKTEFFYSDKEILYNPFLEIDQYDVKKNPGKQFLIIYDDLINEVHKSPIISDLFLKGRHLSISSILLMQTYFPGGSKSLYPQIKNNSTIQIFTKLRNLSEIGLIARRLEYTKTSIDFFSNIYREKVTNKRYGYLCCLLESSNEKLRYITNLLSEDCTPFLTVHTR